MINAVNDNQNKPLGSVLVVGGGMAGIQASLDLSDSGYKVYLLSRESALGGHMAMLDKTFPTNDCSMCTMSPKLVSVAQDDNIELITLADLISLEGSAGNFTAKVRVKPRFVDEHKCTGCGDCAEVCPVVLDDEFNQGLNGRTVIHRLYPQAVPNTFVIERDQRPRCMKSCPLGTNPQGYIALIRAGRYHEALRMLHETNPLPSICSRVCHRPCECSCGRSAYDEPISIMALKRFLVQYCNDNPADAELQAKLDAGDDRIGRKKSEPTGKRVAIVGAGPAGLTAADELVRNGHDVVVFESLPVAGGMLRVGIPDFRLPPAALEADIQAIRDLGADIRCGKSLGRDFTIQSLKDDGYDAVLVAIGAHAVRKLGVDGEDAPNVLDGVDFLRKVNLGESVEVGSKVAVIGGGNVAVDVARTARRLGGKEVTILYRRSEAEMPAMSDEIEEARHEGVGIELLVAPTKVITDDSGKAIAIECVRMELGEPDESGRRRPVPKPGTEFQVDAETIVTAIGQQVDIDAIGDAVETKWGKPVADEHSLEASLPGVFAAGDAVTGPDTVTRSMAQGRRAAVSIDNYLAGRAIETGQTEQAALELPPLDCSTLRPSSFRRARSSHPTLSVEQRLAGFDEVDLPMSEEAALEEAERCLQCGLCSDCRQCERVCEAGAVDFDQTVTERTIDIGGVIVASGHKMYDAARRGEYGYGRYPNVVTALQFERLLSASGPTGGQVLRPGDGKEAHRIAFIQCVGSRDTTDAGNDYCSGVCCMYATKAAMLAKDHCPDADTTIFMIDMRAHGKGYEAYYNRAQELGVRYVRSMVSAVRDSADSGDLSLQYACPDGANITEQFDLVVLSTGLECHADANELAKILDVELDEYGFIVGGAGNPVATSRRGVAVCGTAGGPKDIPDSVTEASAAAATIGRDLSESRFDCVTTLEYPPERDVSGQEPRVGVFICHCGNNIAGVVDVDDLVEVAKGLPDVVYAESNLYSCAPDGLAAIRKVIQRENLNRVVVASCTYRTHAAIFQQALMEVGLNKYLFEMANIRDQCSWVHSGQPAEALDKARDLMASAVGKARNLSPLVEHTQGVEHSALIVGGGLAGMVAAGNLAGQGFDVELVEKSDLLGGQMQHVHSTLEGLDVDKLADKLIKRMRDDQRITVHLNSKVIENSGSVGNFESTIASLDGQQKTVRHGATIVAVGGEMHQPTEYGCGSCPKVITQRQLENRLADGQIASLNSVVMIQCVGCRNEERGYCSRICCAEAIKNALEIKQVNPACRVVIAYKDVRTFGTMEKYYLEARRLGVAFVRYDDDNKPEILPDGTVKLIDLNVAQELTFETDLVALSAAVITPDSHGELAQTLRVPMTLDGFYLEAHVKLRPVDFACEGVFLAGLAHGPKFINETIVQALAASGRAAAILSRELLTAGGAVATVDADRCAACLTCVRACPYGVPQMKDDVATIEPTACQGCGSCAAQCPGGAIELQYFTDEQISAAVEGLFLTPPTCPARQEGE
jgi:heterodisulfide reductase subunit A-like polyferredoxin